MQLLRGWVSVGFDKGCRHLAWEAVQVQVAGQQSGVARRAGQMPGSWLPIGALTWSTAILFLDGLSVGPLDTGNPKAGSSFPPRQDPCVDVLL